MQKYYLGIELGSTRIKAVTIDENYRPVSSGDYTWKSDYTDGVWTYSLDEALAGLKAALSEVEGRENIAAEGVAIDTLTGHGGLFKTPIVGQSYLAAACNAAVTVMETAGEGGPFGMALLAAYLMQKAKGESLEAFLSEKVFAGIKSSVLEPKPSDVMGFKAYIERFKGALEAEKTAVKHL